MQNDFLLFLEGKGREWIMIIGCEEREIIKKIEKNWYFNEIEYKIDN